MKKHKLLLVIFCIFLVACNNTDNVVNEIKLSDIDHVFLENSDFEIGYCDVSDYYLSNYFKSIENVENCKIYISNDSTNFDEIGIFEFYTTTDAHCQIDKIKEYLIESKNKFESGIVYNVYEYPKFKASTVRTYGRCLVYTILSTEHSKKIFDGIKKLEVV